MFPDNKWQIVCWDDDTLQNILVSPVIKIMYLWVTIFSKSGDRVLPADSRNKDGSDEHTFSGIDWSFALFIKH